ncbi:hypothetical protein ACP4OV_023643 [Aristida adscensionis]
MGLLDQLWDDTVAGPRPDSGLGKLRKYASFSPSSSSAAPAPAAAAAADGAAGGPPAVTRSITMLRPPAVTVTSPQSASSSAPSSPASAGPDSPFGAATTPKGEGWKKLRRMGRMADGGGDAPGTPRSPTVYDWCGGDQFAGPVRCRPAGHAGDKERSLETALRKRRRTEGREGTQEPSSFRASL